MKHLLKKILIIMVSLSMIIALALSLIFLYTNADHVCNNQEICPVCACISACKKIVGEAGADKTNAFALISFGLILIIALAIIFIKNFSLIGLKIRMNN